MTNLIFLERRGCMFQFLTLLKDAHLGQISQPDDYDYELLYQASTRHDVTALLYNQIYRFSNFPDELKQQWKRKAIQINALQTIRSDAFLRLYREFLKQDLKVLVLKGIVMRSLYLQPDNRPSNDEDLYVEREHVQKAKEILLEQGFQILQESENVTVFVNVSSGLTIEMHTTLFSEDSKAYGSYQKFFKNAFEEAQPHMIQGCQVYSLSHEQHLLFLMMHFVKHFLHGGVGFRQLLDIIIYAETYGKRIDWNAIYVVLKQEHLLKLVENLFAIGHQYLGFSFEHIILPRDFAENKMDFEDLLADIWDAGIFGKSSQERLHSSTITLSAAEGHKSLCSTLFPPLKSMQQKYNYLKRAPILLPLAWSNRILHYVFDKKEGSAKGAMEIGNQRVRLLQKYGIIEEKK